MDINKIQKFEDEVKELFYNAGKKDFWDFHAKFVIDKSKELSEKYGAELETVWLGAILHDIARLDDVEPHDEIGSERAYEMLIEKGFALEIAEKVKSVIFTHRCKNHKPEKLEQKIVATADSLSHFIAPFYLWVASVSNNNFQAFLQKSAGKLERDYSEKIFFEEERKAIQKEYEILKDWLNYES